MMMKIDFFDTRFTLSFWFGSVTFTIIKSFKRLTGWNLDYSLMLSVSSVLQSMVIQLLSERTC